MTQRTDQIVRPQDIIFNWGEYLGKRASYILKHMGYGGMTTYPKRGPTVGEDYVVFDYTERDILFFVRNGLIVEIRFLSNYPDRVFNLAMGMTREQVTKTAGKPNKILKAAEIGFEAPFEQVYAYSDMGQFDFTLEVLFDERWFANQINIYP